MIRILRILKTNGFAWAYWQDDSDAKGDSRWDGPDLYVVEWWRAAKIKPYVEPSVTAWLHCTDAIAADWRRNHSYLKTCDKAFAQHAKQEHIREMAAEIHAGLETVHKELDHKRCLTIRWKHPRAFFVDTLKEQCRIIGAREKKQRAIARAQKEIRKYIAKKNFRYARMLLPKLEKAGAEPWEIENAAGSIDTAERFEKDRKAKQEAEQRGNRLMNLVPNFERTCLRELQTWTFAHNQLHRSAKHGQMSLAEYWEQAKARSGARGCDARRQATEAYTIHEGQGHLMAANAVLEGAVDFARADLAGIETDADTGGDGRHFAHRRRNRRGNGRLVVVVADAARQGEGRAGGNGRRFHRQGERDAFIADAVKKILATFPPAGPRG